MRSYRPWRPAGKSAFRASPTFPIVLLRAPSVPPRARAECSCRSFGRGELGADRRGTYSCAPPRRPLVSSLAPIIHARAFCASRKLPNHAAAISTYATNPHCMGTPRAMTNGVHLSWGSGMIRTIHHFGAASKLCGAAIGVGVEGHALELGAAPRALWVP
jgi:hypothetical protein